MFKIEALTTRSASTNYRRINAPFLKGGQTLCLTSINPALSYGIALNLARSMRKRQSLDFKARGGNYNILILTQEKERLNNIFQDIEAEHTTNKKSGREIVTAIPEGLTMAKTLSFIRNEIERQKPQLVILGNLAKIADKIANSEFIRNNGWEKCDTVTRSLLLFDRLISLAREAGTSLFILADMENEEERKQLFNRKCAYDVFAELSNMAYIDEAHKDYNIYILKRLVPNREGQKVVTYTPFKFVDGVITKLGRGELTRASLLKVCKGFNNTPFEDAAGQLWSYGYRAPNTKLKQAEKLGIVTITDNLVTYNRAGDS